MGKRDYAVSLEENIVDEADLEIANLKVKGKLRQINRSAVIEKLLEAWINKQIEIDLTAFKGKDGTNK